MMDRYYPALERVFKTAQQTGTPDMVLITDIGVFPVYAGYTIQRAYREYLVKKHGISGGIDELVNIEYNAGRLEKFEKILRQKYKFTEEEIRQLRDYAPFNVNEDVINKGFIIVKSFGKNFKVKLHTLNTITKVKLLHGLIKSFISEEEARNPDIKVIIQEASGSVTEMPVTALFYATTTLKDNPLEAYLEA